MRQLKAMLRDVVSRIRAYRRDMTGSGSAHLVAPVPRLAELKRFEGLWVAVIDGSVVQAAPTSHELAVLLHGMDHRKRARVTVEFVRPTSDSYIVGVG